MLTDVIVTSKQLPRGECTAWCDIDSEQAPYDDTCYSSRANNYLYYQMNIIHSKATSYWYKTNATSFLEYRRDSIRDLFVSNILVQYRGSEAYEKRTNIEVDYIRRVIIGDQSRRAPRAVTKSRRKRSWRDEYVHSFPWFRELLENNRRWIGLIGSRRMCTIISIHLGNQGGSRRHASRCSAMCTSSTRGRL